MKGLRMPVKVHVEWIGFAAGGPVEAAADSDIPSPDVHLLRRLLGRADDVALAAEDLSDSVGVIASTAQESAQAVLAANAASRDLSAEATPVASSAEQTSAAMAEVASSSAIATQVTDSATSVTAKVQTSVDRLFALDGADRQCPGDRDGRFGPDTAAGPERHHRGSQSR
jgi:hypothetical protein